MISDGTPWRPFTPLISVRQLSAHSKLRVTLFNQIFNVGDTTNNYQVKEIAEIIAEIFKDASLVLEIVVQITAAIVFLSIKLTKRYRDSSATGMREVVLSRCLSYSLLLICQNPLFLEDSLV